MDSTPLRKLLAQDIFENKENIPPPSAKSNTKKPHKQAEDPVTPRIVLSEKAKTPLGTSNESGLNGPAASGLAIGDAIQQFRGLRSTKKKAVEDGSGRKIREPLGLESFDSDIGDSDDDEAADAHSFPALRSANGRPSSVNRKFEVFRDLEHNTDDEDQDDSLQDMSDTPAIDDENGDDISVGDFASIGTRASRTPEGILRLEWLRIKNRINRRANLKPQPATPADYHRPAKKLEALVAQPATKLFKHLHLIDEFGQPKNKITSKIFKWLETDDETLKHRIALVAPRMHFSDIKKLHGKYEKARPVVLQYLREKYSQSAFCMLFSEFIYVDERNGNNQGACLFLLVDAEDVEKLREEVVRIVKRCKAAGRLGVFVKKGRPRLFGSYSLPRDYSTEEDEEDGVVEAGVDVESPTSNAVQQSSMRWFRPFNKKVENSTKAIQTTNTLSTPPKKPTTTKGRKNVTWEPSPTPPPISDIPNVIRLIHAPENPVTEAEMEYVHYGLRWVTASGIPSADEGVNSKYEARPNIGASVGNDYDEGSGTLAGYLTDGEGKVYAMTCHHVIYNGIEAINPIRSNEMQGKLVHSPSNNDLEAVAMGLAHEIDGLQHEVGRSRMRGETAQAKLGSLTGRNKINTHDKCVLAMREGGAKFGTVAASSWKIAHTSEGPMIMDQVLIEPEPHRIGSNTFTYLGRDNKYGKRYRLEARGWAQIPLGGEVLKIGRTTGLTRGTVISLNADLRLCVGQDMRVPAGHFINHFWEIQTGVITNGSGPWFSEPGDSGAWILHCPSWAEMLEWDLKRRAEGEKSKVADPVPAPVGGMLFGGADSVEGISLTFYNPTEIVRRYLAAQVKGGEKLMPGLGKPLDEPEGLDSFWKEQVEWSKSTGKTKEWGDFVDARILRKHRKRFSRNHMFRDKRWEQSWGPDVNGGGPSESPTLRRTQRGGGGGKKGLRDLEKETTNPRMASSSSLPPFDLASPDHGSDINDSQRRLTLRTSLRNPLRRRGTSEEAPDTPTPSSKSPILITPKTSTSNRRRQPSTKATSKDRGSDEDDDKVPKLVRGYTPPKTRANTPRTPVSRLGKRHPDLDRMRPRYNLISPRTRKGKQRASATTGGVSDTDESNAIVELV